ncbi:MAG: serine hydrolase [Lachnospiraceae bacterium]|nr:serine hydrolase [Lachnospiraceae bacterium]
MLTFQSTLPENTGIPSGCIINFIKRLKRHEVPMHSILLFHKNHIITEGYYAPFYKEKLHRMFSVSKSFTSVAIGLLAEEGKLSLDDKIVTHFPEKVPDNVHPYIADMTIRDMLMMRTCHASTTYKQDLSSDWVESFFTVTPTHPAGKLFHYDTSSPHTLCALVEKLTGKPMLDYLKEKLAPLGFSAESYMITDPFGVSMGGSGLVATTMDLLRFAYLIYNNGMVEGKQLLSAEYIKEATSHLSDTRMTAPVLSEAQGYGYQFWRNEKGGYCCYGMGGQLIIFLPDYDMICITTADTQGIGGGNQLIYDALYEEILPYISSQPLPVNTGTQSEYYDFLSNLKMTPLRSTNTFTPDINRINNRVYTASENPMGFETVSVSFETSDSIKESTDHRLSDKNAGSNFAAGTLSFRIKGQDYSFSFGFDSLLTGCFPIYDQQYAASGLWVNENTLYIKAHIIDAYVGSVYFELVFGDDDLTVFMKKQEESLFREFNGHLYCTI